MDAGGLGGQAAGPPPQQLPGVQTVGPHGVPQQKPGNQKPRRRVLTSLGLQVFVYFGGWWAVVYYIINILIFVYKGEATRT